jgi:hypothetical protein
MPFAGDVPDKSFAVYRIGNMEMQMAKCWKETKHIGWHRQALQTRVMS